MLQKVITEYKSTIYIKHVGTFITIQYLFLATGEKFPVFGLPLEAFLHCGFGKAR